MPYAPFPDRLAWRPDSLLGEPFEQAPLREATLVRLRPSPGDDAPRGVVLHVHGYNDYFFQAHLARAFAEAGYLFYAVDLRAAGRSLRPEQVPHYVTDLREQATDVARAASTLRAAHPGLPLVVHAHSTGGLTTALWAHAHRHATGADAGPDALVLDSPFLELPGSAVQRAVGTRVLDRFGPLRPLTALSHGPSWYAMHLRSDEGGAWGFDPGLKRPQGVPVRAGWLRAVRRAQARVARGLAIACPVLLAASSASSPDGPGNPRVGTTDTVLDVGEIVALAPRLGRDVTVLRVPDGVHDLSLSAPGPRAVYLREMLAWLATVLP